MTNFALADLKEDVPVTVHTPLGIRLSSVDRVTKEFVFVDGGKYCRKTGHRIGTGGDYLRLTTVHDDQLVQRRKLMQRILDTREDDLLALELAELTQIVELLKRGKITGRPKRSLVAKPDLDAL